MAVDTRDKRASAITTANVFIIILPNPDASVDDPDRQQVAYAYAGITAAAPVITPTKDATWQILVDWNRDGDYSDTYEDITAYVIDADWQLGMKQPFQDIADESVANLTLKNVDKRFSPEYASGPLYGSLGPHKPVRIQSTYGGTITQHYNGWIDVITPAVSEHGELTAMMRCVGPKQYIQKAKVNLPLMTDVTADTVLEAIFDYVHIPPAGNVWALDVVGHSELEQTTYLGDTSIQENFETGRETFSYVGDTWDKGIDAYRAIKQVVEGERGRLFFDRGGTVVFWNRHHLLTDTANDGTVNATMQNMSYSHGEDIANIVKVTCHPRTITDTYETLWSLEKQMTLQPSEEKSIRGTFSTQDSDSKVSGMDVQYPSQDNSTLGFVRGTAEIQSFTASARSAEVVLKNPRNNTVCDINILIFKGRKITIFNPVEVERRDGTSIFNYGPRELSMDLALLDDEEDARAIAGYELARRKDARGMARTVTLMNKDVDTLTKMIQYTIGTRLRVVEVQTAHDSDYFIIGEKHRLQAAGLHHICTWTLEPASGNRFWILGVAGFSELEETTVAGPL